MTIIREDLDLDAIVSLAINSWINLDRVFWPFANLHHANLFGVHLPGADLRWADLRSVDLSGADLSGADLTVADLSNANLKSAFMYRVDLRWASLCGADLTDADLSNAVLRHAELRRANMTGVDMEYADLRGAAVDEGGDQEAYRTTREGYTPLAPEIAAFREWAKTTAPTCSDAIRKGGWDESDSAIFFIAGLRWAAKGNSQ